MVKDSEDCSVVVIGAGIIGSCCALQLVKSGYKVTLIDQDEPGNGCSYGNAGSISPGSVMPMALPGIWKNIPAWLFDSKGPLSVKWGYLVKAAPWLAGWLKASSAKVAIQSAESLAALHTNVIEAYQDILGSERFSELIKTTGHLIVYKSRPQGKADLFAQMIRDTYGVKTQSFNESQMRELVPELASEFKYGLHMQQGGFTVNPQVLVQAIVREFADMGGHIIRDKVIALKPEGHYKSRVHTRISEIKAQRVVIAAGAWSKSLCPDGEVNIPLETERGYHLMLYGANKRPALPIVAADYKFFSSPMEEGLRLAGTVEIGGLNAKPNWSRAGILLEHAKKVFPGLTASGSSVWMGHRPSVPDSVPVIDESDKFKGIYYAFGHGHFGLSGAPGTARIISDLVSGITSGTNPNPFGLARFRKN